MKAITRIKTANNKLVVEYEFNTIKEAIDMAKHQVLYAFSSPLTVNLNRIDVYVNVCKSGKNVFYKFANK
jgi:hypothetical protein